MSLAALTAVLRLPIKKSSDKFILVCLANYTREEGLSYPSHLRLQADTSLDRKTVIAGLQRLVEAGHICDTGERHGETKQIIVWKLLCLPEISAIHYVYKITDLQTGEFYIGKRSCDCAPHLDPYMGGGAWPVAARKAKRQLTKTVLSIQLTSDDALAEEAIQIAQSEYDPLCRNEGTKKRARERQANPRGDYKYSPVNGTVQMVPKLECFATAKQSQISLERVPDFPLNGPENGIQNLKEPKRTKEGTELRSDAPSRVEPIPAGNVVELRKLARDPFAVMIDAWVDSICQACPHVSPKEARGLIGWMRKHTGENHATVSAAIRRLEAVRPSGNLYAFLKQVLPKPKKELSTFDQIRQEGGFSSFLAPQSDDQPTSILLEAAP